MKAHGLACLGARLEHAIDHHTMKMHMRIEQGAKAVNEGDSANAGRAALSHRTGGPKSLFHSREKDVQGQVLDGRGGLQEVA